MWVVLQQEFVLLSALHEHQDQWGTRIYEGLTRSLRMLYFPVSTTALHKYNVVTFEKGANPEEGDAAGTGKLTQRSLHEEQGNATQCQYQQVWHQKRP
jgi:hypothetical protein